MPISIIEAMSQAVPIISTPVGGIPELIQNEINGILVSPGNPNEIAHAVLRLTKDPDLCKKLGSSGYDHFMSNYEFSKGIHEIRSIYEQVLRLS
jgi:glycosyltransferase involved in cell wall biosynthesis